MVTRNTTVSGSREVLSFCVRPDLKAWLRTTAEARNATVSRLVEDILLKARSDAKVVK